MIINFESEVLEFTEELKSMLEETVKTTLDFENFGNDYEINILIVDKDEIKRLNKEFRNIDKVTDVLSFPQYDEDGGFVYADGQNCMLGDVVLCLEKAQEQAYEFGHSEEREFCYLTCHSVLHLLGYDHMEEEEKIEMRTKEKAIMNILYDKGIKVDFIEE